MNNFMYPWFGQFGFPIQNTTGGWHLPIPAPPKPQAQGPMAAPMAPPVPQMPQQPQSFSPEMAKFLQGSIPSFGFGAGGNGGYGGYGDAGVGYGPGGGYGFGGISGADAGSTY